MTNTALESSSNDLSENQTLPAVKVEAVCGVTQVEWDNTQPFTPVGQLVFFAQFLNCSHLFSNWVSSAPLYYTSNNAPSVQDILGTLMLSVLVGHKRYCNIEQLYGDKVCAEVLGLSKLCSDDSSRRGVKRMDESEALSWLDQSLKDSYGPMIQRPWILDLDSTVKTIFGNQEGGAIGYNPKHPGRPSYSFHSYFIANTRMTIAVEVRPGNEHAGTHTMPRLFELLDSFTDAQLPEFIRGDVSYGNEKIMSECEKRNMDFLFKLRTSPKVKSLLSHLDCSTSEWLDAGQGWHGQKSSLLLSGWSKEREVVILRRKAKDKTNRKLPPTITDKQNEQLLFKEILEQSEQNWEYTVLVTSLDLPVMTLAQHYRDRGDCENNYDEYKNQWGWGGFTSKDFCSTKIMAGVVALIANWWNVYTRLAIPQKHAEAITSRPYLLQAVGRLIRHGGQRLIRISTTNAAAEKIAQATKTVADFLNNLTAEQSDPNIRWKEILKRAFIFFECREAMNPGIQIE